MAVAHRVHVQHPTQQLGVVKGGRRLCHAAVALVQQLKQVSPRDQLPLHVMRGKQHNRRAAGVGCCVLLLCPQLFQQRQTGAVSCNHSAWMHSPKRATAHQQVETVDCLCVASRGGGGPPPLHLTKKTQVGGSRSHRHKAYCVCISHHDDQLSALCKHIQQLHHVLMSHARRQRHLRTWTGHSSQQMSARASTTRFDKQPGCHARRTGLCDCSCQAEALEHWMPGSIEHSAVCRPAFRNWVCLGRRVFS